MRKKEMELMEYANHVSGLSLFVHAPGHIENARIGIPHFRKELEVMDVHKETQEYLKYLEEHQKNIVSAWKVLNEKCKNKSFIYDDFKYFILDYRISIHDISKYSAAEFTQYRRYFFPTDHELELPNREKDFEEAKAHHIKYNAHHWENWTKNKYYYNGDDTLYCVEMVCDWMAMSYSKGDTAREYYEKNKGKIILPDWAIHEINSIFDDIEK